MASDGMKRDEMIDLDELKPMKKYQFDINCRFDLRAESKSDAIIVAVERLEGIEITNILKIECQELIKSDN
jgi:hypothetical protein